MNITVGIVGPYDVGSLYTLNSCIIFSLSNSFDHKVPTRGGEGRDCQSCYEDFLLTSSSSSQVKRPTGSEFKTDQD